MSTTRRPWTAALRSAVGLALSAGLVATCVIVAAGSSTDARATVGYRRQSTQLISQTVGGGLPNGPSTHAVISGDQRYARVIAFQSQASNLVRGDRDGQEDVFAVFRTGHIDNSGLSWHAGRTRLISRTFSGKPANGPSFAPAVGGGFYSPPRCIAFLSAASNLVPRDTNRHVDAFVSWGPGGKPQRLPLPRGRHTQADATAVTASGDCSRIAFLSGGRLYVWTKGTTRRLRSQGAAYNPRFSAGRGNDLVFGTARGVFLVRGAAGRPRLIAPGGAHPAYNDLNRPVLAYEVNDVGITQIAYKDLGRPPRIISSRKGVPGDGPSTQPVIGNSGYYVSFESGAANLSTNAAGWQSDTNKGPDVYLYSDVRHKTLVESVANHSIGVRGQNPSMSFYANYILFDSPAPLGFGFDHGEAPHQVYMRYLGPA